VPRPQGYQEAEILENNVNFQFHHISACEVDLSKADLQTTRPHPTDVFRQVAPVAHGRKSTCVFVK
jgi:hypothetical protein